MCQKTEPSQTGDKLWWNPITLWKPPKKQMDGGETAAPWEQIPQL